MKDQVGTYDLIVKDDPREGLEGPWTDLTTTQQLLSGLKIWTAMTMKYGPRKGRDLADNEVEVLDLCLNPKKE